MRVLHLNTERGWRGGERQTLLTLLGLRQRGVWAGLAAQPDGPLTRAAAGQGIPIFPWRVHGGFDPKAAIRLAGMIKRECIDVVHAQTPHAAGLALMAGLFGARKPLVASRRVDFRIKSPWKYNRFAAVVAISEAVRSILRNCGVDEERIKVIPSGVPVEVGKPENVDALRRELANGATYLAGSIGHLAAHKGLRHLVEALPRALERIPDLALAIIGDGECRADLEERAERLGVRDRIVFTGFRPDAPDLLWALDLLVVPSLEEGLCTTLFDAMLRGVPIVASAVGGIPEALGDGRYGLLVPPSDSNTLADALCAALLDGAARRAMTSGAPDWVRGRFSDEAMVGATLELYKQVLGPA